MSVTTRKSWLCCFRSNNFSLSLNFFACKTRMIILSALVELASDRMKNKTAPHTFQKQLFYRYCY